MPEQKNKLFLGTFVHSQSRQELEFLHDAAVCVDSAGTITHVVKARDSSSGSNSHINSLAEAKKEALKQTGWKEDDVEVQTAKPGQFFFPGFIDTHIHAPQYPNAGIFGKSSLLDWLKKYTFPEESSHKNLTKARQVYTACVRRTLAHGTTTAAYFATLDVAATNLLADLCLSFGQRAFVGRVCMDNPETCPPYYLDESPEAGWDKTTQTIKHIDSIDPGFKLVSPIITPRFAPSCTGTSMKGLAKIQREWDIPVQTHISENKGEIALVADLFKASTSYADVYADCGLLTPKTILAHGVHLSEAEARLIASTQSKISHCPCSNSSLTSGAARVRWMWDHDITVGLGTDVSGGYSPSVLEAARQATLVSRHVAMGIEDDDEERERVKLTVEEALYLATRGGAAVVSLEDKLGAFEPDMEFDAQLVNLGRVTEDGYREDETLDGVIVSGDAGDVDVFGWEEWDERMAKWLYNGDDRNTRKVWVRGRLVHAREK